MKKKRIILCFAILIIFLIVLYFLILINNKNTNVKISNQEEKVNTTRKETLIQYDVKYEKYISSKQEAIEEIIKESKNQREKYKNREVNKIEKQLEEKYNIYAVNLGEMNPETAKKVEEAFAFMFDKFPKLSGQLTNVTLGNFSSTTNSDSIALVEDFTFIDNPDSYYYPQVVKHQMVLNAREFLNTTRMENIIKAGISSNHWTQDTNVQAIIVHELGHVLIDMIRKKEYELEDTVYITEANYENYMRYVNEGLSANQKISKEIVEKAYHQNNSNLSYEEFCKSISGYALGLQKDGGYSYTETCAEACSDFYLHGENCSEASKLLMETIIEYYNDFS